MTAAAADDDVAVIAQGADGAGLDDVLRLGRGHVPPPAAAGVLLVEEAGLFCHLLGFFLGEELADGLAGRLEGGVIGIHLHLGDHGHYRLVGDTAVEHLLPQSVLEIVADVGLAHGAAHRQGRGALGVILVHQGQHGVVDDAHLGAVAVGDDDLVAVLNEIDNGAGGDLYGAGLLGQGGAQGIAAQGDDNALSNG